MKLFLLWFFDDTAVGMHFFLRWFACVIIVLGFTALAFELLIHGHTFLMYLIIIPIALGGRRRRA